MSEQIENPISSQRLVVISNRLPIVIEKEKEQLKISQGMGGLVTALAPVLRNRAGLWIGWTGNSETIAPEVLTSLLQQAKELSGFTCCPVPLTQEDIDLYYHGFSNEIIWPLFHDLQSLCNFVPSYWNGYQKATEKFAEVTIKNIKTSDFIWVQDYQLMLLGQELRKRQPHLSIAFFLHIPFPSLDMFLKLPWRFQIIRALLEFDCIGFQTVRDVRNFIRCVKALLPDVVQEKAGSLQFFTVGDRKVSAGAFPISIDFEDFYHFAQSKEVADRAWHIHEGMPGKTLILSVDRLDYTKGIPNRLEAFRSLLKRYPEVHKKVTLVQVTVPSRIDIPRYNQLKSDIDKLVSEINSEFTENSWIPIHYVFRSLSRTELIAFYRTCEIALVTSLKDGMNLVAKEYIACDIEQLGVLILSEFAGATSQLRNYALIVNPYDIEGIADAMHRAIVMPKEERKWRMRHMQQNVKRYNIFWWLETFFGAAINKRLEDFSVIEEYVPTDKKDETKQDIPPSSTA